MDAYDIAQTIVDARKRGLPVEVDDYDLEVLALGYLSFHLLKDDD